MRVKLGQVKKVLQTLYFPSIVLIFESILSLLPLFFLYWNLVISVPSNNNLSRSTFFLFIYWLINFCSNRIVFFPEAIRKGRIFFTKAEDGFSEAVTEMTD